MLVSQLLEHVCPEIDWIEVALDSSGHPYHPASGIAVLPRSKSKKLATPGLINVFALLKDFW